MSNIHRISARTDLTQGPIAKKLILFALPILAGNIITQLYNVVDSIVVGQFVGSDALAAVSLSFPIMMLFNVLIIGLAMGANILIAQYRGARDFEALGRAVNTIFLLCLIMGGIMSVMGIFFSRPLLMLLGTPENILDDASWYLMIVFMGTIGNIFFMLGNGLTRGLGDSRWPLYALTVSSVLNVLLDLLFVIVFRWGVPGVAIATMVSHFVAGLMLVLRFIRGKYGFKLSLGGMKNIDREAIKIIVRLGIPTSIQNGAMSLGMVIIQSLANNFGSDFIAANGIIMRVDGFIMMPLMGIGMAITTFVGQNIGAGNPDRAKKGTYTAIFIITCFSIVMGFTMYHFGIYLMRAFTSNERVLEIGFRGLRFLAFFHAFMGINHSVSGAMRGAGEAKIPALFSVLGNFIRIPIAYALALLPMNNDIHNAITSGLYATNELARAAGVGQNHYMGLFYSMGISMVFGAIIIMLYFMFGKWQNKAVVRRPMHAPPPSSSEDHIESSTNDAN